MCIEHFSQGLGDIENDEAVGFHFITSDDIDDHGVPAIIKRIRERIGDTPVYLRYVHLTFRLECC